MNLIGTALVVPALAGCASPNRLTMRARVCRVSKTLLSAHAANGRLTAQIKTKLRVFITLFRATSRPPAQPARGKSTDQHTADRHAPRLSPQQHCHLEKARTVHLAP